MGKGFNKGTGKPSFGPPIDFGNQGPHFTPNITTPWHGPSKSPPPWGPEYEASYPFRRWVKDIITWSLATDTLVTRQAHQVVLSLSGVARALAQEIPVQQLTDGGLVDLGDNNGPQQINGLAYLLHRLSQRFHDSEIETSIRAISEIMSFQRLNWESVDEAIIRFDILTYRSEGVGFDMTPPGKAWWLMLALRVPFNLWPQIFMQAQTGGSLPTTEEAFNRLKKYFEANSSLPGTRPKQCLSVDGTISCTSPGRDIHADHC